MAGLAGEQVKPTLRRGIVQVDRERVVEVELEPAQRALIARRLLQARLAALHRDDPVAVARQIAGAGPFLRPKLPLCDAGRHVPGRIDHHAVDGRRQHRRLVAGLSGDRAHGHHRFVVAEQGHDGRPGIHLHAGGRHHRGQPPPALHVGDDLQHALADRLVQVGRQILAHHAVRSQAEPALGALHRLLQWRVKDRRTQGGDLGILGRQPRTQRRDARIGGRQSHRLARRQGLPAAGHRDLAIARQTAFQRRVSRIAWREAIEPGLQAILRQGLGQIGSSIIGRRTHRPIGRERGGVHPPDADVVRIADDGGGQGRLLGRGQLTGLRDPIQHVGLGLQAMEVGGLQHFERGQSLGRRQRRDHHRRGRRGNGRRRDGWRRGHRRRGRGLAGGRTDQHQGRQRGQGQAAPDASASHAVPAHNLSDPLGCNPAAPVSAEPIYASRRLADQRLSGLTDPACRHRHT